MAKTKIEEGAVTGLEQFNDKLTDKVLAIKKNRNRIIIISIITLVVVAGCIYYFFGYMPAKERQRHDVIALADQSAMSGMDSIAAAQYDDASKVGGNVGNRAKLNAAQTLYRMGKYEEALKYLNDYTAKEHVVGAAAYALKGDCEVNLDQLDKAADSFKKAIKQADENPVLAPYCMEKLARVYAAQGNHKEEIELLEKIDTEYPNYVSPVAGLTIKKELELAKQLNAE